MQTSTTYIALRARWFSILAATLVGGIVASSVTLATERVYEATSEIFVAQQGGTSSAELLQSSAYVMDRMDSYAQTMNSGLVLQAVIDDLDLDTTVPDLSSDISTLVVEETVVIEITARSDDSAEAMELANAVAARFQEVSASLDPQRADGSSVIEATVIQSATQPGRPASPRPFLNLFLGLLVGSAVGVSYALIRRVADRRVRTEAEVQELLATPILAHVPLDEAACDPGDLFESAVCSESIRQLRTGLQFLTLPRGGRSFVITSARRDDGRTAIALSLAAAQANAGHRVCYVEADLRHPSAAQRLGLAETMGLTDVLVGVADLDSVTVRSRHGFDVILAGSAPPNPADLLARESTLPVIRELETTYDVVILDTPPLIPATEGAILSQMCTGTLFVIRVDRRATTRREVGQSAAALENSGAPLLGVIFNYCSTTSYQRAQRHALPSIRTPNRTAPTESPPTHHDTHSLQVQ
ncbi:polysaccharide biosynthesis tyrosine autokinase [Serinicoccus hydrothermalis]|uniref:polysaccharide biosynthesis tyrosine autokinase n=1 Tax=Serinicoccus hydrothermalis TaxID=1758689 RepID=UPI0008358AD1|nr:polysaccharide biosynthesis tyrosine autokinase [Serinicoccus hydrothermalis]